MRSGHSLAFKHFEEILSEITISSLESNDLRAEELMISNNLTIKKDQKVFLMSWESKSDWDFQKEKESSSGECVLIPLSSSRNQGKILRSNGYSEKIKAKSDYLLLENGTLILSTIYNNTIAEEMIWFVSQNVRCRSSVIKAKDTSAVLQISHSSEVRITSN